MTNEIRGQAIEQIANSIILSHDPARCFVIKPEDTARHILQTLESLGYVQLDPDQNLPENPYPVNDTVPSARESVYREAQQDILNAGFKKVKR